MGFLIGDFELDTARELLIGPNGPVTLRRQAYRLLLLLAERAPALVPREALIDSLWGHQALSPNVLPQTLSELRQALGDDPQQARYIATRHRRGYALVATVRPLAAAAEQVPLAAAAPPPMAGGRLVLALDVDEPRLQALLRLRAACATSWAVLVQMPARGQTALARPAPASGMATTCWRLKVDRFGQWQLCSGAGQPQAEGRLPLVDPDGWAAELLPNLASATGHAKLLTDPTGWPGTAEARHGLVALAMARDQGHPGAALAALDRLAMAAPLTGWLRLWQAQALTESGALREARTALAALGRDLEPKLALQAEALHKRLGGLPNEALAAWRAGALLVPEDLDARLTVLDAQLAQAQWAGAADGLAHLADAVGDHYPPLQLRLARWLSADKPPEADAAFQAAVASADALERDHDRQPMRLAARTAYAQWLLERNRLDAAADALAALPGEWPEVLQLQALLAREQGRLDASAQACRAAVDGFLAQGRQGDARRARLGLAELSLRTGDPRGAATLAQAEHDEAAAEGDPSQQVDWLTIQGRAQAAQGQFDAARVALQQAIVLAQSQHDARRAAIARYHLGAAFALERQRPHEAEHAFRMGAEAFRGLGDDLWEVKCLANLALMAERAGRRLDARSAYRDALARLRTLGVPLELGRIEYNAGVNERELGHLDAAAAHLDAALAALTPIAAVDIATMAAAARADLALAQADAVAAQAALQAAAELRQKASAIPASCWCTAMARVCELAGLPDEADTWLAEAIKLRSTSGVRTAQIDGELRRICLCLDTPAQAAEALWPLQRMAAELQRLGEPKFALWPGLATVAAHLVADDAAGARAHAEALSSSVQVQGNRVQQLQLEWLLAWASHGPERSSRLAALQADASSAGYHLLVRLVDWARSTPDTPQRAQALAALQADRLAGAARSAASIL